MTKKTTKKTAYELMIDSIGKELEKALKSEFKFKGKMNYNIEVPPNAEMGDFAVACFAFAKELKSNPIDIASRLSRIISDNIDYKKSCLEKIENKGAYLNFFLNPKWLAKNVLEVINENKELAAKNIGKGKKVMIEYVSPNTNKPLHLGHIRNGLLGFSVAGLLEKIGYKVIKANLVNDRGIHICKSMVAYSQQKLTKGQPLPTAESTKTKGDHFVGQYYVMFDKLVKQDPKFQELAQECLKKWEDGDSETIKLWKKMNAWVYKGFAQTYKRLGIDFDKTYYESEIYKKGKDLIDKGLKKGMFKKDSSGAIYVELEKYGMPNKILLRGDGTSVYATQDMYLAVAKNTDYKLDKSIYVVGSEQNLYLKQLFKTLEVAGYKWAKNLHHLSYGMVYLPEGKMKSREGTVVDADLLMDGLEDLIEKEIREREEVISEKEIESRSEIIAQAALKYYMLEVGPESDMHFNPKESISIQGRTGPYIQYAYARLSSIIKKSGVKKINKDAIDYDWIVEKNIILQLAKYGEVIAQAAEKLDPSILAKYVFELAKSANEYYHQVQVIKEEESRKIARLYFIEGIKKVMKESLAILGIKVIDQM